MSQEFTAEDSYSLYPPAELQAGLGDSQITYGPDTPISGIFWNKSFMFGSQQRFQNQVPGNWTLMDGTGNSIALETAFIDIWDDGAIPTIPVVSFRINSGEDGIVDNLQIQWKIWDAALQEYADIEPDFNMGAIIQFIYWPEGDSYGIRETIEIANESSLVPEMLWRTSGDSQEANPLQSVSISMMYGDVLILYEYR